MRQCKEPLLQVSFTWVKKLTQQACCGPESGYNMIRPLKFRGL